MAQESEGAAQARQWAVGGDAHPVGLYFRSAPSSGASAFWQWRFHPEEVQAECSAAGGGLGGLGREQELRSSWAPQHGGLRSLLPPAGSHGEIQQAIPKEVRRGLQNLSSGLQVGWAPWARGCPSLGLIGLSIFLSLAYWEKLEMMSSQDLERQSNKVGQPLPGSRMETNSQVGSFPSFCAP